jgi:hypothetical protein
MKLKAIAVIAVALFFGIAYIGATDAQPEASTHEAKPNHKHYFRKDGVLAIDTGSGPEVIYCSLQGWVTQNLYYRHDLPVIAEGCATMGSNNVSDTR